ncbi:MAG: PAS domain S-box protein [Methanocella sp.]
MKTINGRKSAETTDIPGHINEHQYRRYYPAILGLSLLLVIFLAVYVNLFLGIDIVYTHLFYIPIILAGIWYHRKAVYIALFLGALHIVLNYFYDGSFSYSPFLRAIVFVFIAYIIGTIAARKDLLYFILKKSEGDLRHMRDSLEQQVRERTLELSGINESLRNEIAERKKAEDSFRLTRFSIDKATYLIGRLNPDGSFNYVNDALCRASGFSHTELLSKSIWDILPDFTKETWPEHWSTLRETGSVHSESTLLTREGRAIPIEIVNNYIDYKGKTYDCIYIRDISERKRAENALKKSRAILARAQIIAHVGNWAWNLKTGQMQWSDELFRIFGYSPGDTIPSYDLLLSSVCPGDRELVSKTFQAAARDNILFNIDYRIVSRNGAIRYVNSVADKLARDPAGNPAWIYGITQDITNRKRAEAALHDAKEEAELYLDLMSHDINNLNQTGIGFLEMALDTPGLPDETKALISKPLEALESSTRLIKNVTRLQRAREGDFCTTRVNVCEVIREVLPKCSGVAGRDIRVDFHGCDCFVVANDLLTDVFSNIIGNAIKHSIGPLIIDINLEPVLEDDNAYCAVSVADNGPGIPDSLKRQLFVKFKRGTTKASGRGLGLYLVKMLVDGYGGRVWVEDRIPGDYTKGAKFVVMLPAVK